MGVGGFCGGADKPFSQQGLIPLVSGDDVAAARPFTVDGHGSGGGGDIDECWAEFGPCLSWAWPVFVLYVVDPGLRPIGVNKLNVKFGFFKHRVLDLGLFRWLCPIGCP